MTSNKPYILRAFYEWIVDNNLTPYIVLNTEIEGVAVPEKYIEEGKITLNIAPVAVQGLHMTNEVIHFNARFGGVSEHIVSPIAAVMAVYARENGRGMVFGEEESGDGDGTPPPVKHKAKPKLTVVK